jgi:hypothetical protein
MNRTCSGLLLVAACVISSTETWGYTISNQLVGGLCHPCKIKVLIPETQLSLPHPSLVIANVNSFVQMH